jgi:hypothetical protein
VRFYEEENKMAEIKKTDSIVKPVAAIKTPVVAPVVKKTEVKAAVVEAVKTEVKKAEPKKAAAKKPVVKKAAAKKTVAKKAEPKKETKPAAKKPAAKKAVAKKPAAKKTAAKKPATKKAATKSAVEVKTNIVLQYGDKAVSYAELIQNAKNKFQYDMGGNAEAVKKISLYVKPEENKVYFVMDDKVQGSCDL